MDHLALESALAATSTSTTCPSFRAPNFNQELPAGRLPSNPPTIKNPSRNPPTNTRTSSFRNNLVSSLAASHPSHTSTYSSPTVGAPGTITYTGRSERKLNILRLRLQLYDMLPTHMDRNRCLPNKPVFHIYDGTTDEDDEEGLLERCSAKYDGNEDRKDKGGEGEGKHAQRNRKPDLMRSCWGSVKAVGLKMAGKKEVERL